MKHVLILLAPALLLAGCGDSAAPGATTEGETPDININAKDGDGSAVSISASGSSSSISVDGDGVNINADLPGIDGLDVNSDIDIDGVKLYPGAKIISVDVNADSSKPEGQQGSVAFGMTAPAAPDVVLAWYAKAFAAKGVTTTTKGATLSGKTKDGDAFTFELSPDGKGSKGKVRILG